MDTLTPEQISNLNETVSMMRRYRPNPDSFQKEICCDPYTILYGDIEFLRHYMDPQIIPGQTQADFDEEKDLNHALMAELIKKFIYIRDNQGLKLLIERMNVCKQHKFIIYGGQPQEYARVYGQLPRYDESHFFEETNGVNILNYCFQRNNLVAFKMFLEDGVDHNCLTKNMEVYVAEDPQKIVELTVFSKMILKYFLLCLGVMGDWNGYEFHSSWKEYTSRDLGLRLKQFIKSALLKDNPGLLRSNLETVGNPSTKMLVDGWLIGLDDIDKLLYGRSELMIRNYGYKIKENYDEALLVNILNEIETTLESCISEVENYNLMVAKQRASVAKAFESQHLTSMADSYLDRDTRGELLSHVLQQKPNVTLSRAFEPSETFEDHLRSNRQGGGDKQTKKKTKQTKKKTKKTKKKTKQTKKKTKQTKKKKGKKSDKQFLYNPDDPEKSFDVYIDKDPSDTIPIKYKTIKDVKNTIKKLEKLYKNGKYPHKRIWQVGMIMYVRLKVLKDKKPKEFKLSEKYFKHLGKRTKIKGEKERKKYTFKI